MNLRLIFYFILFFAGDLNAYTFRTGEFEEIKRLGMEIVRTCPSSECHYVGLGRSPTALMSFFDSIGISEMSTLPLSEFRYYSDDGAHVKDYREYFDNRKKLSPHQEELLFQHFKRTLPDPKKLAGKKLMIVDFADSGESLIAASTYLQRYFSANPPAPDIHLVPLTHARYKKEIEEMLKLFGRKDRVISIAKNNSFVERMDQQKYDEIAKFKEFRIPSEGELPPLVLNPGYQDFAQSMKKAVKNDSVLQLELQSMQFASCP